MQFASYTFPDLLLNIAKKELKLFTIDKQVVKYCQESISHFQLHADFQQEYTVILIELLNNQSKFIFKFQRLNKI